MPGTCRLVHAAAASPGGRAARASLACAAAAGAPAQERLPAARREHCSERQGDRTGARRGRASPFPDFSAPPSLRGVYTTREARERPFFRHLSLIPS